MTPVICNVNFLRPAQPGQFPWLVSVTRDGRHVCGGVILTSRHVLTAATCVQAPGDIGVTIREHHLTRQTLDKLTEMSHKYKHIQSLDSLTPRSTISPC